MAYHLTNINIADGMSCQLASFRRAVTPAVFTPLAQTKMAVVLVCCNSAGKLYLNFRLINLFSYKKKYK